MQVREILREVERQFAAAPLSYGHGTSNPRDEAVYLVYSALEIDFSRSIDSLTESLPEDQALRLRTLVRRRIDDQVPTAYLVGQAWFAGRRFLCDPRALIPRSPIAELIANNFQPLLPREPERILDLCAGGGCIGIACTLQFPRAQVVLSDISEDCLALAADNILLHDVARKVTIQRSDLFAELSGPFDLIVSNPPYVSLEEVEALPQEYRHEPSGGLLSEEEGLAIPLAILRQAADYLSDDGLLIMEVGLSDERLQARLPDVPFLWLDFEEGGEGVLALTARQLRDYADELQQC